MVTRMLVALLVGWLVIGTTKMPSGVEHVWVVESTVCEADEGGDDD